MAYSSKYYDPQKAHKYYMRHRQLKDKQSRTSTASLSETGKVAAKEVKAKLTEERNARYKALKSSVDAEIQNLRAKLKSMSKEQRAAMKDKYAQMIDQLRSKYKSDKASVKEEYDNKYAEEVDKIKSDQSMLKQKKGRSGGGSKSSGKASGKAMAKKVDALNKKDKLYGMVRARIQSRSKR